MIGKPIGHYQILSKLGEGGMGEVYRAHDETLDRDVAIKLLPAGAFGSADARARLLREARSAAALNHPNICTIHEVGEAEGQAYIAMELVEGKPLSTLAGGNPLPSETVLRYGIQIADALAHAHDRRIVHRDLKTANVVISADGRAKVLDFGLAKRLSEQTLNEATTQFQPQSAVTEPGTIVGTLAYMAPEQLRGEPADARSDIWALGVTLFEISSGERPFQGHTGFEVSSRILSHPQPPLPSAVPIELRAVIEKCLAKDPGHRYQHAGEVRAALEAIQTRATGPVLALRYHFLRRRWFAFAAAGVLLLAVAAGIEYDRLRSWLPGGGPRMASLAVLPLENLSGDPAQDYLASGIHEALITDLSKFSGFRRVTARSSVKRYEKTTLTPGQIAKELDVDALLTGTVLRSGGRVQITAHLITASETQVWSERYDREFRDVFSLQNDIVSEVTKQVRLQVTPLEQANLRNRRPVNAEAFEAYLQGRFHSLKQTPEDYDQAERYYRLAIEKEPNYALAYAGLGNVWLARGDIGLKPPREAFPLGTEYLAKAVALDDSAAEVHVSLANHFGAAQWDWPKAEEEFKRAIELNPNLADAHFFYADLLIITGRVDKWRPEIQRSRELDPLNEFNESFYGWHLNYLHRYDEAIPIFQKLLPAGPNKATNYLGLWGAYYRKGMYSEALAAARSFFTAIAEHDFAGALGTAGGAAGYRAGMRRVGELMAVQSERRHVPATRIARMFAHAGDKDLAMQWLEKAYQARESPLMRAGVFWDWDDLRSDPRFKDLMRRLKLPG